MEAKKAATATNAEVKGDSEGEGEGEEEDVWKRMKVVHEKPLKGERSVTLCRFCVRWNLYTVALARSPHEI